MTDLPSLDRVASPHHLPTPLSFDLLDEPARPPLRPLRLWQLGWLARVLRAPAQAAVLAAVSVIAPTQVRNDDRLDELAGPVIFAANHVSHLDTPVILRALPPRWRRRVAVAAALDYFFRNWLLSGMVRLLFNAFPVSRSSCPRSSLDLCRQMLRNGWSLVIYPEGTRSPAGDIAAFKPGVGLLAVASGVPVIPLRTDGLHRVLPRGKTAPRRGRVTLRFGTPLAFESETPASAAAAVIESAVRGLGDHPEPGQPSFLTPLEHAPQQSTAVPKGCY